MINLAKAENKVGGWLKSAPHLPKNWQRWIAENAWWIVLVGIIALAISIMSGLDNVAKYTTFVGNASSYLGLYVTSPYAAGWIFSAIISLSLATVVVILLASAISAIKEQQKKGWERLFIALMICAVSILIGAFLTFNVFDFIFNAIFGGIGLTIVAYFIFEIRSYFVGSARHVTVKK
jgi:FtsH-binding integral membrane protein